MGHEMSNRLAACIDLEITCAKLYKALASFFPEDEEFWSDLSASEQSHANILNIGRIIDIEHRAPGEVVPPDMLNVEKSLVIARSIQEMMSSGDLVPLKALQLALLLEESTAESYFFDLMRKETDSEALASFQRLYSDEKRHAEKIKAQMVSKGFLKQA